MRRLFHPSFVGFYVRYALRFFGERRAFLLWARQASPLRMLRLFRQGRALLLFVACCLGQGSVASAQVPTWTSNGPEGGRIQALAIDPATPTTLYAGIDIGGGVFGSSDGGATWSALNTGLPPNTSVQALAIDPVLRTPYAGTNGGGVFALQ